MTKKKQKEEKYKCEVCGATAAYPKECCGEPMQEEEEDDSDF
jgi:uncharacterized OB-fold protein